MPAKLRVDITEVRSIGAVLVSVHTASGYSFVAVPRDAVEVESLSGGIRGSVTCTILGQAGGHYMVQIPEAGNGSVKLSVPEQRVTIGSVLSS